MKTILTATLAMFLTLPQLAVSAEQPAEIKGTPKEVKSTEAKTEKPADLYHVGTVAEAISSGNYLYLKMVDVQGEELWLATNPAYPGGKVEVGEKLEFSGGVEMGNFKSKTLDRTFDKILFITKIRKFEAKPIDDFKYVPADDLHSPYAKESKPAESSVKAPGPEEIVKPENGRTIEELISEKDSLKDKEILFRARVMKFNTGIMKKNWATLQDGTGAEPDNKIIATSSEIVELGDTVTVKGILKTDVDFGAGYFYKVIIENATFTK